MSTGLDQPNMTEKKLSQRMNVAAGQVRSVMERLTPEEQQAFMDRLGEFAPHATTSLPEPEPTEAPAAPSGGSGLGAVFAEPSVAPTNDAELDAIEAELDRRERQCERDLDRGYDRYQNTVILKEIERMRGFLPAARLVEPGVRRYGCSTNRSEQIALDGWRDHTPIRFENWVYETSHPLEIAIIEDRITNRPKGSAYIQRLYNGEVALVDYNYRGQFWDFEHPDRVAERVRRQMAALPRRR